MRGELKKIKILFTGKVGPYREIFLSVLKTSLGLRPRAVFKTSRNISLYIRTSNPVNNIYILYIILYFTILYNIFWIFYSANHV